MKTTHTQEWYRNYDRIFGKKTASKAESTTEIVSVVGKPTIKKRGRPPGSKNKTEAGSDQIEHPVEDVT